MKTFFGIFIFMFLALTACQRSQFSTTTRHYKNGKATYANRFQTEKIRVSEVKYRHDNLLASASNAPIQIRENENPVPAGNESFFSNKTEIRNPGPSPDTVQVIRFKSGVEEKVKIVYQSTDTLKYHLISEPAVVRTVLMKQVDSIFMIQTERTVDTRTKRTVDTRKPERLGLAGFILSFPCLFVMFGQLFGLPLSILAVIFGAVSLRRVRRYPERYKKEFGLASLILGIIGIVVTAIFWIVYAVSV